MILDRRHALGALVLLAAVTVGRVEWHHASRPIPDTSARALSPTPTVAESPPASDTPQSRRPIVVVPARADAPAPPDALHPHPITAEHERIFRENRLIGAMNGATDVEDAAGLRRLLAQYREEYPEDGQELSDGYAVIADCLESPGDESRAAAERWSAEHAGSTLRRFVIRHCFPH